MILTGQLLTATCAAYIVKSGAAKPDTDSDAIKRRKRATQRRKRLAQARAEAPGFFSNDLYAQSFKEIDLEAGTQSEEQQAARGLVKFSSILMGTSVASAALYPPLLLAHVPPLLYVAAPMFKEGWNDLVGKRKVTTTVVDVALAGGSLMIAPFQPSVIVISCVGTWIYGLTNMMVLNSKDNTRKRLTNLLGEAPQTVWVVQNGVEIEIPYQDVEQDDILMVRAGEMIPVDGAIIDGFAGVDQRMLTGEARPVDKGPGDEVFAATVVLTGHVSLRVHKTGEQTAAARIGDALAATSDFTASVQLRGQEISDRFSPMTLALGTGTALFVGPGFGLAVLLSGIGYNMRMLGPLSVLNFLRVTASEGILIKDGRALEQVGEIDTVVFDKTGTLTLEQPSVGGIRAVGTMSPDTLLSLAAAAEYRQTHPIALAILEEAERRGITPPKIDDAAYEVGYGVKVKVQGRTVHVGSKRYMTQCDATIPDSLAQALEPSLADGASVVYIAVNGAVAGAIELHPTLRPEAKQIVAALRERGLDLYIISGDQEAPTRALARDVGIEHVFAETLPEGKADHIARLQEEGRRVCFVGDGINDSIALKKAHVSVSLKGASSVATDTAQVVLMDCTLNHLDTLFTLSDDFERTMRINLATSVVPGVAIIGGALMGAVGFGPAMAISLVSGTAGVANAMAPLLKTKQTALPAPPKAVAHRSHTDDPPS